MESLVGIAGWVAVSAASAVASVRFANGAIVSGEAVSSASDETDSEIEESASSVGDIDETDSLPTSYAWNRRTVCAAAAVALATVATALAAAQSAVTEVAFIELAACYAAVLAAAIVDLKKRIIPNLIPVLLVCVQVACFAYQFAFSQDATGYLVSSLLGGFLCFVALTLAGKLAKNGIGAGDVKLVSAMGLACGLYFIMYVLMFSLIVCAIVAAVLVISKKRKKSDGLPFAPFLYVGFICAVFVSLL